jgi:ethanolamine permease
MTIVIGGQYFSWNEGLKAGFWLYFGAVMITGSGYLCLVLCLSEITSALPFSGKQLNIIWLNKYIVFKDKYLHSVIGGAYGFVRMAIGPYPGFLTGCCEILQSLLYLTSSLLPFGNAFHQIFLHGHRYEPTYWAIFLISSIPVIVAGGKVFWTVNNFLGIFSLGVVLLFIFSTCGTADFYKNAYSVTYEHTENTENAAFRFMKALPVASWFFIGVEMLTMAGGEAITVSFC